MLWLSMPLSVGAAEWSNFKQPKAGAASSIGRYNSGCLQGGRALPLQGDGYQVMRVSRNRYYGHPELVRFVSRLGDRVRREKLGVMLVGDLSMPRGGPFASGHRSHQTGLDVDIGLRLDLPSLPVSAREDLQSLSMVKPGRYAIDPAHWSLGQARLIELAAEDPSVARIFVNAVIKRELCRSTRGDRNWLRNVRPWFGHRAHLHVRLRCPEQSRGCVSQLEPPPGDGCGAELASWFPDPNRKPQKSKPPKPRAPLPAQCTAMLRE
ncbi:MAG: penicillin-insensitive murein endopeptidase [Pseudomonadota bacterium]|nr:penicillin-insensitive murein endopeptidase [Pseudomonadota bacterium]